MTNEKFKENNEILDKAAAQLKREFFGIDDVIDSVVENIRAWYSFPEMQERPLIISLWGMTGVGKTSLVRRLASLIDRDHDLVYFNFAAIDDMDMDYVGGQFEEYVDRTRPDKIFVFDEFQYAATLDGEGEEKGRRSGMKTFWELMDTGLLHRPFDTDTVSTVREYLSLLNSLCGRTTPIVVDGKWTNRQEAVEKMSLAELRYSAQYYRLPYAKEAEDGEHEGCGLLNTGSYTFNRLVDVENALSGGRTTHNDTVNMYSEMDYPQFRAKIESLNRRVMKGYDTDYRQSVIFVLGNLDEAYEMTFNVDPDMSPDQFHRASKKISVVQVKQALQHRFRNEQIARLGNIHLIYPSFSSETFKKIISNDLDKFAAAVEEKFGLKFEFEKTIQRLIYNDSVFPTHGTRPIFSTIHEIVKSRLPGVMLNVREKGLDVSRVSFGARGHKTTLTYYSPDGSVVDRAVFETRLRVDNLRNNTNDDQQALVAVHESGHFIVYMAMKGKVPEKVCSRTADKSAAGFVMRDYDDDKLDMMTPSDIRKEICVCLAGQMAEELIFGKENMSNGATSDLNTATSLASAFVRKYGFDSYPYVLTYLDDPSETSGGLIVKNPEAEKDVNERIAMIIAEARSTVHNTLRKRPFLTALKKSSKYLMSHPTMNKKVMESVYDSVKDHIDMSSIRADGYYRNTVAGL